MSCRDARCHGDESASTSVAELSDIGARSRPLRMTLVRRSVYRPRALRSSRKNRSYSACQPITLRRCG